MLPMSLDALLNDLSRWSSCARSASSRREKSPAIDSTIASCASSGTVPCGSVFRGEHLARSVGRKTTQYILLCTGWGIGCIVYTAFLGFGCIHSSSILRPWKKTAIWR